MLSERDVRPRQSIEAALAMNAKGLWANRTAFVDSMIGHDKSYMTDERIMALADAKLNVGSIALIFGCTPTAIYQRLKKIRGNEAGRVAAPAAQPEPEADEFALTFGEGVYVKPAGPSITLYKSGGVILRNVDVDASKRFALRATNDLSKIKLVESAAGRRVTRDKSIKHMVTFKMSCVDVGRALMAAEVERIQYDFDSKTMIGEKIG